MEVAVQRVDIELLFLEELKLKLKAVLQLL
jgi:hypothetical protein